MALVALLLTATAASGAPRPGGQFTRGQLGHRAYRLYVPGVAVTAPGTAAPSLPLVIALHGCWQTPEDFALGTRLNEAAERRHLFVLYPAQSSRDNATRCWNWFDAPGARTGEAGEILDIVRRIAGERRVARDRIVALGFSAGAFMAVNLGCVAPDVITGVGAVAGGPFRCGVGVAGGLACMRGQHVSGEQSAAACREAMGSAARQLRASLWHGTDDVVVSPVNLDALAVMFARLDRVVATASERREQAEWTAYGDASGRTVVETWLIPGMGHAWSGGDLRGTHTYPPGPSATDRILDFLLG